ncbi:hypothetical protein DTO166G4_7678 [Paecilomyces variotii]|uniref:Serum paraoxonase/arylesterase family protein n=1 Tax=Byssochlamys spectabilis TaxID=264951 RepID=A0A443I4D2_BYSSP|nr:serum paraoxonase/arylesterase family protein [Paecilomyces variotii]KAJ9204926.1 hypothetical protein DTO164E3_1549 [Paecilomyces variotii]KAJ9210718.1 hypothetical protein DTO166G4_7678 [Paecilomyces variotii]KAJ9225605.1 hypothetical protein DTO169C6_2041 [Paecilomyces variotii]KAJ9243110.1 hypothetical protein DTO166G5_214 [Paecilomyces variotii]KAJ9252361.1 hypothetical protein DTO195F2_7465 [Paecilomyces variotii]
MALNALLLALLTVLLAVTYGPVSHYLTVIGAWRHPSRRVLATDSDLVKIEDTIICEDLHLYHPTNTLFSACEDDFHRRFGWFPPLGNFENPPQSTEGGGSIHIIDPETKVSARLEFENFSGPLVTHGIDVVAADPSRPDHSVYIFAVNHLPNPDLFRSRQDTTTPKARSQIELFYHVLGSKSVRHVRSIWHPLIRTPNDIYAENATSFYVTNDHFYRDGLLRHIEDVLPLARWSTAIHVQIEHETVSAQSCDQAPDVKAGIALTDIFNNNGLGHGQTHDECLVTSAAGGLLYLGQALNGQITIREVIPLDSVVDNPSYFSDPFVSLSDGSSDASGYIVPGLPRAVDLPLHKRDPSAQDGALVWHVKPSSGALTNASISSGTGWEARILFEDDGSIIRTASAAVLVPIDPKREGGRKRGWLFVTGFLSENIIAVKVDL